MTASERDRDAAAMQKRRVIKDREEAEGGAAEQGRGQSLALS